MCTMYWAVGGRVLPTRPRRTGGTLFLTSDHLGSTRVETDQGKAIKGRQNYLRFGDEISAGLGHSTIVPARREKGVTA
jgi:hypothetical protein